MIKRRSFLAALAALPLCCIPFISRAQKPPPPDRFRMKFTARFELDDDGMIVKLFAGSIRHAEEPRPLSMTRVDIEKQLKCDSGFRREQIDIASEIWGRQSTFHIRDRQIAGTI